MSDKSVGIILPKRFVHNNSLKDKNLEDSIRKYLESLGYEYEGVV